MEEGMRELRLALPKGRILDDALLLLKEQGYPLPEEIADTRKLLLAVPEAGLELILAKRWMFPPMWSTVSPMWASWEKMS
ncbi:fragment of ATP phosphoribosyltransferase (part 1) [[Clostridium] ultunense Esp]|nr:fragment of ATP phosphoribosyltransferase (part 1) [[Clostridium] ultunense Esp]